MRMRTRLGAAALSAAAAAALAVLGGCTANLGDFTVLASKNVDLTNFRTDTAESAKQVVGKDEKLRVLGIGGMPNLKEAVDRAEEQGNAPAITNVRLTSYYWWALVVDQEKYTVTGNPVKLGR
jgi:hypothetical protein